MPDFLTEMASKSRARALSARSGMPERELRARILDLPDPLPRQTGPEGFDLITEVKRRSPSIGPLDGAGVVERARAYTEAGAAAISVLTEPDAFGGSLEDLQAISRAASELPDAIPAMRKDFLTDPYQLLEARAAGAGGALLILRIVSDEELEQMLAVAGETGLFLLLEAFDADDIERAGVAAARATSVVRYLQTTAGIDPVRLSAVGLGPFHPVDTNDTPEGRARNRRIEIKLVPLDPVAPGETPAPSQAPTPD